MDNPLVSIIVPVYNAEATLHACLSSICAQSYANIEVVLVNDGSTDDSLSICRAYAALDERIVIVDKPNSGVSASRNAGIERARGKYLQFVDGDDYLSDEATRLMVERAEQTDCDLVIAEFFRVVGRRMTASANMGAGEVLTQREFARCLMDSPLNFYYGVMWNKLYRRDIVMQHGIRCCTELKWCEDFLFNMDYYAHVGKVAAVDAPVYYYVKRRGSLSNSYISMAPARVFKMKRTMYVQYRALLEGMELYSAHRAQTRMFFLEFARDGGVPPFAPQQADKARMQAMRRTRQRGQRLKKYRAESERGKVYRMHME